MSRDYARAGGYQVCFPRSRGDEPVKQQYFNAGT